MIPDPTKRAPRRAQATFNVRDDWTIELPMLLDFRLENWPDLDALLARKFSDARKALADILARKDAPLTFGKTPAMLRKQAE